MPSSDMTTQAAQALNWNDHLSDEQYCTKLSENPRKGVFSETQLILNLAQADFKDALLSCS